ncbi:MAG: NAD(P)H-dependent oxidoreductase subunit E [Dethiobacteria bacterium]|nr:NAD(P)H-dependent oxidoreductase subunit E [Bacillota bacterium]
MEHGLATEDLKAMAQEYPVITVKKIVEKHINSKGAAIPILQDLQNVFGHISPDLLRRAAEFSGIPVNELYSIVTFYAQFRLEPIGEHLIQVCHGTACHLADAEKITESIQFETKTCTGKTSEDGLFTLEKVACLGCCSLAPVMTVDEATHGKLSPENVRKILKTVRRKSSEQSASKGDCENAG